MDKGVLASPNLQPVSGMYPQLQLHQNLKLLAQQVLKNATDPVRGVTLASALQLNESGQLYTLYPFMWLWDTGFIAAWNGNLEQSKKDIRAFLSAQRNDGFIPHISYGANEDQIKKYFLPPFIYPDHVLPNGEYISQLTQPPNLAWAAYEVAKKLPPADAESFIREVYPKLLKYHTYLIENRVRDGLMISIHPWETGQDNSGAWDTILSRLKPEHSSSITYNSDQFDEFSKIKIEVDEWLSKLGIDPSLRGGNIPAQQKPSEEQYYKALLLIKKYGEHRWDEKIIIDAGDFAVADQLTNSLLIRSYEALGEMAFQIGDAENAEKIKFWRDSACKGLDDLWDEQAGLYFSKDLKTGSLIPVPTSASFLPLFAGCIDQKKADILSNHIQNLSEKQGYLLTSTFPQSSTFVADRYWRGPVWILMNVLIMKGLILYGKNDLGRRIMQDSLELIVKSVESAPPGFHECFHPQTGEPLRTAGQSWTAASVLEMLRLSS